MTLKDNEKDFMMGYNERNEFTMFIAELIFALLIALLFTLIFSIGFRGYRWGIELLLFFTVLFLVTWVGGIWVTPFGPLWFGVPWLSFLFVGLMVALIMTAWLPHNRRKREFRSTGENTGMRAETLVVLDAFFFILIACLIIVLIVGYAVR